MTNRVKKALEFWLPFAGGYFFGSLLTSHVTIPLLLPHLTGLARLAVFCAIMIGIAGSLLLMYIPLVVTGKWPRWLSLPDAWQSAALGFFAPLFTAIVQRGN